MTWRHIETAPRDGTWFWGNSGVDAIAMRWHDDFEAFVSSWRQMTYARSFGGGSTNHSPVEHSPTHWMPRVPVPSKVEAAR